MTVEACSRPLIMRVMIIVAAQASADTKGKNAAGWNALVPGRRMISTPARPTTVASHRRRPTLSLRKRIDSAVTKSGETNPVAEASAIGRYPKPVMNSNDDDSRAAQELQAQSIGAERKDRRARHHGRRHDQREDEKPDPGDFDRRQGCREIFRGGVGGAEEQRGRKDQRNAAKRPIGARWCNPGCLLLLRQWQ